MHGAPIGLWLTAGKIGALRTEPPFRKVPLGGARGVVGVWDQGRLIVTKTTKQRYEGARGLAPAPIV